VRLLPESDGMDDESRLAETDGTGTGTGVALGERERIGVLSLLLFRTVVLPLANDALEMARGFDMLLVDMEDPRLDVRLVDRDIRVDDSEGAVGGLEAIFKRSEIVDGVLRVGKSKLIQKLSYTRSERFWTNPDSVRKRLSSSIMSFRT